MLKKIKLKFLLWFLSGLEKDGIRRRIFVHAVVVKLSKLLEEKNMKSWKTTLFGLIGAVGAYLATINDPAWMSIVGGVLSAIGVAGVGMAARDNGVSSEEAGAK